MNRKNRNRFAGVVLLAILAGLVSYPQMVSFAPPLYDFFNRAKINLGLDLQGGIHLEYKADTEGIESDKVDEALQAVQDVIERRVNAFGVGEPLVQTAKSGNEDRIVVELPGIKDIEEAKKRIKDTPILEFREEAGPDSEGQKMIDNLNAQSEAKAQEILDRAKKGENFEELAREFSQDPGSRENGGDLDFAAKGTFVPEFDEILFERNLSNGEIYAELVESDFGWHIIQKVEERGEGEEREVRSRHILFQKRTIDMIPQLAYQETGLTGRNLESAQVVFANQGISEPQVSIRFDEEGTELFAEITKRNIGKPLAIFLDGDLQSSPTVQTEITNGEAVITGNFTADEANELVRRLNEGALPVPLELVSQQSVEASLGEESLRQSLRAGAIGIAAVMVFMVVYYRFLGLIASLALLIYTAMMVSIFKLSGTFTPWPITLTLSGIAGFILSLGMAVDANVLIFERLREELRDGKSLGRALEEAFRRAWPSIRDGNYSTIITTLILVWVGTSFVKGFALILMIGVIMSMFTAIVLVKYALRFVLGDWAEKRPNFIMNMGKGKDVSPEK